VVRLNTGELMLNELDEAARVRTGDRTAGFGEEVKARALSSPVGNTGEWVMLAGVSAGESMQVGVETRGKGAERFMLLLFVRMLGRGILSGCTVLVVAAVLKIVFFL